MAKYRFELLEKNINSYSLSAREFVKTKKNDIPKEIRYIPSCDALYVEKQKSLGYTEKEKGEVIDFPASGFFRLDDQVPSNKLLIERLQLSSRNEKNSDIYPSVKPMFREIEETAAAQKEVNDIKGLLDVLNSVMILDENTLRATAFSCGLLTIEEFDKEAINVVRSRLGKHTQKNHQKVQELLSDDLREQKDLIIEALACGALVSENPKMSVITHDSGQLFAKNIIGESAIKDGAVLLKGNEGQAKMLKIKVSQIKGGVTSFDEAKVDFIEDTQKQTKLADWTYPRLVNEAMRLVEERLDNPFINSGASYKLTGHDATLTYTYPDGRKKAGKEGLRLYLEHNEEEMKKPLAEAMVAFI